MTHFTLATITTPALEASPSWVVDELTRIEEAQELLLRGNTDAAPARDEWIAGYQPRSDYRKVIVVAFEGDGPTELSMDAAVAGEPRRIVGHTGIDLALIENRDLAFGWVSVDPARWGEGIGTLLWEAAKAVALEHGCTTFISWTDSAPGAADIIPTTGSGSLPADHASRFALRCGFTLDQVSRRNVCPLPVADEVLAPMLIADSAYQTLTFESIPPEYLHDVAWLWQRMADAPQGTAQLEETQWTPERVMEAESLRRKAGRRGCVTVAQEKATGKLVGYTALFWSSRKPKSVGQADTIVLPEHRGHRLGWLIKATNLQAMLRENPEARQIRTFNAAENENMLAINQALGFRMDTLDGEWLATIAES